MGAHNGSDTPPITWERGVNERLDRLETRDRRIWLAVALLAAAVLAGLVLR